MIVLSGQLNVLMKKGDYPIGRFSSESWSQNNTLMASNETYDTRHSPWLRPGCWLFLMSYQVLAEQLNWTISGILRIDRHWTVLASEKPALWSYRFKLSLSRWIRARSWRTPRRILKMSRALCQVLSESYRRAKSARAVTVREPVVVQSNTIL